MIRFIQKEEIDALVALCEEHAKYEKTTFDKHGKKDSLFYALFNRNPVLYCLVATDEDKHIIGYATFMRQFSTWDAQFYTYLDCLYLAEPARGKGIGQKLMLSVKEESLKLNCNLIQWQTPDFNVDAIRFYKRLGAISKSKERFFWKIKSSN